MSNNIYSPDKNKKFKFSYWYVSNKVLLRRIFIVVISGIAGIFLLYGIWGVLNNFLFNVGQQQSLERNITEEKLDLNLLEEINKPKDIQIGNAVMLAAGQNKFDFVGQVTNPNSQWQVTSFDYYFRFGSNNSEVKTDFILPQSEKFLLQLNYPAERLVGSVELIIENVQWQKVANYEQLAEKILQFEITEKQILTAQTSGVSEELNFSSINYNLTNKSSYSFWDPKFVILVYSGNKIIFAGQSVFDSFASGEIKEKSILVPSRLPSNARLEIIPDLNILDQNIFKGFDVEEELK